MPTRKLAHSVIRGKPLANNKLSYRQLMVGQTMTGLVGLEEAFGALAAENITADAPELGARLVKAVREHNYVPNGAVAEYERALVQAYEEHVNRDDEGTRNRDWRDPRKVHINWYPIILDARCDGCGECISICPRSVLGWNHSHSKTLVLEPYECAPGCQLCAKTCPRRAIVMPPREALHHLYRMRSG